MELLQRRELMMVFILTSLLAAFSAQTVRRCPPAWFREEEGDKCYWFSRNQKSWAAAQAFCAERSGNLVMVKDGIEADTLKQIRIDNGFTDSDYWVGASQTTTGANLFSYNSGITFNDELWSSGEPSNYLSSSTQCVEMGTAADNYEFGDDNCGERQDYICETALQPICEDTWVRNHMTCIKFVEDSDSSWNNARQACQALGGDLALVKYAAEAQRIEAIRTNLGKTDEAYWVGAIQDRKRSANYRYTDFTSIPRILWFPGQPDDFTSRKRMCVTLGGKDHDLKMADTPCPTKLNYICERDN